MGDVVDRCHKAARWFMLEFMLAVLLMWRNYGTQHGKKVFLFLQYQTIEHI